MYNGKLFQPAVKDINTLHHLWISFVLSVALMGVLNLGIAEGWAFLLTLVVINALGFSYEYGQATGYKSTEGIDPLDLIMNFIGSVLGNSFVLFLSGN